MIPIDQVRCRIDHIRKSATSLSALQGTIEDAGLLQPILVSRCDDSSYLVIDGVRRLSALRELGVRDLIVGRDIVIDGDEREADVRFKQLIANVQREDLNPVELGQAFVMLKKEYGYHYNEIAELIGKTPHYVTAKVGLIKRLDPEVKHLYLDDLTNEKCNQSTSAEDQRRHVMNVNVLEDIARLDFDLQKSAYDMIQAARMDKDAAISYLRTLKVKSEVTDLPLTDNTAIPAGNDWEIPIRKQIRKIGREIAWLSCSMKAGTCVDREIVAEIEGLISQLSLLHNRLKSEGTAVLEKSPG